MPRPFFFAQILTDKIFLFHMKVCKILGVCDFVFQRFEVLLAFIPPLISLFDLQSSHSTFSFLRKIMTILMQVVWILKVILDCKDQLLGQSFV